MKKSKSEIKSLIKLNILKTDPNAEIILFGSQARGDENKYSDWDLLILTNHPNSFKDEQKIMDNLYELELELEEVFSPLIYSMIEWKTKYPITPLYENVLMEGIVL
ncbi:MAG: nucleotidyltransferase domain-containing protein [Bacteroidetes bacterium]|nr:MAG: nucleotidyltransferase domain-containing protein [Bacteroidota bacterium]